MPSTRRVIKDEDSESIRFPIVLKLISIVIRFSDRLVRHSGSYCPPPELRKRRKNEEPPPSSSFASTLHFGCLLPPTRFIQRVSERDSDILSGAPAQCSPRVNKDDACLVVVLVLEPLVQPVSGVERHVSSARDHNHRQRVSEAPSTIVCHFQG